MGQQVKGTGTKQVCINILLSLVFMGVNLGLQTYGKNTDKTLKNMVLRIICGPNDRIMEMMGKFEMYTSHQIFQGHQINDQTDM